MNRGRIVIFVILTVAIGATVFAAWFRWSQGHRAVDFLGPIASQQVRFAPNVELIWLETPRFGTAPRRPTAGEGNITVNGVIHRVLRRADISNARGLIHARQSLIQDATYRWDESYDAESVWSHALIYSDEEKTKSTVLLFDLESGTTGFVRTLEGTETKRLTIPGGFRTFFSEQGAEPVADSETEFESLRHPIPANTAPLE